MKRLVTSGSDHPTALYSNLGKDCNYYPLSDQHDVSFFLMFEALQIGIADGPDIDAC